MSIITPEEYYRQKPPPGTQLNRNHPLAAGLVGCWVMNEGNGLYTYDSSGFGNHVFLYNTADPPTPTSGWVSGEDGTAIAFDGNDYIYAGGNSQVLKPEVVSVCVWVKMAGTGENYGRIICKAVSAGSGYGSYQIFTWAGGARKPTFVVQTSSGYTYVDPSSLAALDEGWHQVVGTYDGVTLRLYWDGVYKGLKVWSGSLVYDNGSLLFGQDAQYLANYTGLLGMASIYNRVLSDGEILQLFLAPYGMFEQPSQPIWIAPAVEAYVPQIMMMI